MERVVFQPHVGPGGWLSRGTWKAATAADGRRTAIAACPRCGEEASLHDHEINLSGDVEPSLQCPYPGCSFHHHVTLEGWALES